MVDYSNPYGADPTQADASTQPLDEILRNAVDGMMLDLHTCTPVQVVRVRSNGLVDLQPLIKRKYRDGALVALPVIQGVPVEHPRGTNWWVKLPVTVGDYGRAVFTERSLDVWSVAGGVVDPADTRHHDMSDAVFVPGLYPNNQQVTGAATDMVLHNGSADLKVQRAGTFLIKGASDEVLDLLVKITDHLSSTLEALNLATTNTIFGPMQLNNFATYATLKSEVDTLNAKLTALKGS